MEESEVVKGEVASAEFFADRIEVEVEGIDGIDFWEAGVADTAFDGATQSVLLFFIAETMQDVDGRQILFGRVLDEFRDDSGHAGKFEPAQFLDE